MSTVELRLDVTQAVGLPEPTEIAVTVTLPEPASLPATALVCFAKPGGGYARGYYTHALPGAEISQAQWHADRGWIFVTIDPLGVGDSSADPARFMDYGSKAVTAAAHEAERQVRELLSDSTLADGFPAVLDPLTIGIGQSAGGGYTIAQQGRFHDYDGIAILGFSPFQTVVPARPGRPPLHGPWIPREYGLADGVFTNGALLAQLPVMMGSPDAYEDMAWAFHWDDTDPEVVRADIEDSPNRHGSLPVWASATSPGMIAYALGPGNFLAEAAAVTTPVLVAMGERDVIPDPRGEVRNYLSARSVDLFICPKMAHMHNFASTRTLFWQRIETWAAWVRACREAGS